MPKRNTVRTVSYRGGTATGAGIDFQIEYATYLALRLIGDHLADPLASRAIGLETRTDDLQISDIVVRPPELRIEAKLNPVREDIEDWIDAVGAAPEDVTRFELLYAGGGGKLLRELAMVLQMGRESDGDAIRFAEIAAVRVEQNPLAAVIVARLGPRAHEVAHRMNLKQIPFDELRALTADYARAMVAEGDLELFLERLREEMRESLRTKKVMRVHDLTQRVADGITLQPLPAARVAQPFIKILPILQTCPLPVPLEILAAVVGRPLDEVGAVMAALRDDQVVSAEGGGWRLAPSTLRTVVPERAEVNAQALAALVGFIRAHPDAARRQVTNAFELGRTVLTSAPGLVATLFKSIEHPAKDLGDKHLVLELADLSIAAARRVRDEGGLASEAHAEICGRSWVLQRANELDDAMDAAERSLRLAEDASERVTVAFCHKCIGRLYRLYAQAPGIDAATRTEYLRASVRELELAAAAFRTLDDAEVGDCHSLLARTYFVAGDRAASHRAITEARTHLRPDSGKDYVDLLLVAGDWELRFGESDRAVAFYREALELSQQERPAISEMRARALFSLGRYYEYRRGASEDARSYFRQAAEIWEGLDEPDSAATAWLAETAASGTVLPDRIRLAAEPDLVKWLAFESFRTSAPRSPSALASRHAQADDPEWDDMFAKARHQARLLRRWG